MYNLMNYWKAAIYVTFTQVKNQEIYPHSEYSFPVTPPFLPP